MELTVQIRVYGFRLPPMVAGTTKAEDKVSFEEQYKKDESYKEE